MRRVKFTTLTSLHKEQYGDLKPKEPNPDRCCVEVSKQDGGWWSYSQCTRPRGHGPEQAYCQWHDPAEVAKRKAETDARLVAARERKKLRLRGLIFYRVLCQIADGHADPRALAIEALKDIRREKL